MRMIECRYKTKIKDIQDKYKFKIFCYDATGTSIADFNANAAQKTQEFNQNAVDKTNDFDEHASSIQAELDEVQQELEKAQQDLSMYKMLENALPKVEGEGENITLDNTAKCPMKLGFKGQIQQDSTTGKNLLNYENLSTSATNVGIKVDSDGYIYDESPTGDSRGFAYTSANWTITLPAGNYIINAIAKTKATSSSASLFLYTSNSTLNGSIGNLNNVSNLSYNINLSQEITIYILMKVYDGVFRVQLEDGTSTTDWEQYTGNAPSPSPDYPQDIHVVSGDNTIKVCNKNLLNYFDLTSAASESGIAINSNHEVYDTSSESDGRAWGYANSNWKMQLPSGTYKITLWFSTQTSSTADGLIIYDSDNTSLVGAAGNIANKSTYTLTLTLTKTTDIGIMLKIHSGLAKIQLERNEATNWEAHQEYTKEISLVTGKNKIPTQVNAWEQGAINATNGNNTDSTSRLRTKSYYLIQNDKDYHISVQNTNYCFLNIIFYDINRKYLGQYFTISNSINGATDKTINVPSSTIPNVAFMRVVLRNADNTSTITPSEITSIKPMIEIGSSATSWEAYNSIEMGGIGDYEDEFFKNTIDSEYYDSTLLLDKWYLKKRIGKKTFTGASDENWSLQSINSYGIANFQKGIAQYIGTTDNISLVNYFSPQTSSISGETQEGYRLNTSKTFYARIKSNTASTVDNFKTWLSTHNTIVYYVLATPTNTLLNDTLQETLDSFYSYQEQTNISQENNDIPFVIKASAIYDLTNLVTRVATLETE